MLENQSQLLMVVIFVHVVFLIIQIDEEFRHVLKIVIQFYAQVHEFFPKDYQQFT